MKRLNVPLVGRWKLHLICRSWRVWQWRVYVSTNTFVTAEWVTLNAIQLLSAHRDRRHER